VLQVGRVLAQHSSRVFQAWQPPAEALAARLPQVDRNYVGDAPAASPAWAPGLLLLPHPPPHPLPLPPGQHAQAAAPLCADLT
jgi:hypothetical protein